MIKSFIFLKSYFYKIEEKLVFSKIISILLILILTIFPLAEFVSHLSYNTIESEPVITCLTGWDLNLEPLTFKEIK